MKKQVVKIVFLLIIAGLFLFALTSCSPSADSDKMLDKGASLFTQGKFVDATSCLRQYVFYHPDNYRAHFLLGQSVLSRADESKELYLARYYLNKARELAKNDKEREAADNAYADVQLLMGKGSRSAKVYLESADRFAKKGKNAQAINLYLKAAGLYLVEEEYDDAEEAFSDGLKVTESEEQTAAMVLGQATSLLLNEKAEKCLESLQKLPANASSTKLCATLDADFLRISAEILSIEGERNITSFWKKEVNEGESQALENKVRQLKQAEYNPDNSPSEQKAILMGRGWALLGERLNDLAMTVLAREALTQARSLYNIAGREDESMEIGEKLEKLEG